MSRIRTVKPEFWVSDQVTQMSIPARLLFIGLWNFCDDRGVHPASLARLKAEVLPVDNFPLTEDSLRSNGALSEHSIEGIVGEWKRAGLVIEFEVDDQRWWHVTGWDHQRINRPTPSKWPPPPTEQCAPEPKSSLSPHGVLNERSSLARAEEGKGREGNGKERIKDLGSSADEPTAHDQLFERLWSLKPRRAGSNPKRSARQAFNARLTEGADPDEVEAGFHRWRLYHQAAGDLGTRFVMRCSTFFGPDEHWRESWEPPAERVEPRRLSAVERVRRANGLGNPGQALGTAGCTTDWIPGELADE